MQKTPKIILFLDASRGFGRGILSGIARYSTINGPWTFYRKPPAYLKSKFDLNPCELKSWEPDGIICSIAQVQELKSLKVPMIGYDPRAYSGQIPCITADHAEIGRLAAQHLLDLGHRNFAFCGYNSVKWSQVRCEAFCSVIEKAGAQVDVYQTIKGDLSWSIEEPHINEWLKSLPKPTSIFCANDERAASVIETCRVLEFGIPEDISVIGADDDEYICELENPPLSSVRVASEQAGYKAAQLLHQIIQGKEKMDGQRIIAHAIGVASRQSTDVMMIQNMDVRKALHFIRENTHYPIQVTDVVKATGLSHRTLNGKFHSELGCSIGKYLTRARIDYISRLLIDTDMQIQEVAIAVGYEDDRHLSRYFKRATGLTPQAYRRKKTSPHG